MSDKTVLVVEDDPDTQRGVAARIRASGYRVVVTEDATMALGEARRAKPSLILLDLGVPGGGGLHLLEQLRALSPTAGIPVVVLSGRDAAINRPKALRAGAVAYLEKPAENAELLAVIRQHIGDGGAVSVRDDRVATQSPVPVPTRKVLLIEDDADTRRGLSLRLRASGFATVDAADASTALMVAQREKPDVMILDLGLPGGDGYVVLERLRTIAGLSSTPVIVVSAKDAAVHAARAKKAGAAAFLEKPVDNDELIAALNDALGQGSTSGR